MQCQPMLQTAETTFRRGESFQLRIRVLSQEIATPGFPQVSCVCTGVHVHAHAAEELHDTEPSHPPSWNAFGSTKHVTT